MKYNSKGFSHHAIFPVVALLIVGAIGIYTLRTSSAMYPSEPTTASSAKCEKKSYYKTVYSETFASGTAKLTVRALNKAQTKYCVIAKSTKGTRVTAIAYSKINYIKYKGSIAKYKGKWVWKMVDPGSFKSSASAAVNSTYSWAYTLPSAKYAYYFDVYATVKDVTTGFVSGDTYAFFKGGHTKTWLDY